MKKNYLEAMTEYSEAEKKPIKYPKIEENKNQVDLYYMKSILAASVGWNKNDDVFDSAETWKARSTPEDKQFNYMHYDPPTAGRREGEPDPDEKNSILTGGKADDKPGL